MQTELHHDAVQQHDHPWKVARVLQQAEQQVEDQDIRHHDRQDGLDRYVHAHRDDLPDRPPDELGQLFEEVADQERVAVQQDGLQRSPYHHHCQKDAGQHRQQDRYPGGGPKSELGYAVPERELPFQLPDHLGRDPSRLAVAVAGDVHLHVLAVLLAEILSIAVGGAPYRRWELFNEEVVPLQQLDQGAADREAFLGGDPVVRHVLQERLYVAVVPGDIRRALDPAGDDILHQPVHSLAGGGHGGNDRHP